MFPNIAEIHFIALCVTSVAYSVKIKRWITWVCRYIDDAKKYQSAAFQVHNEWRNWATQSVGTENPPITVILWVQQFLDLGSYRILRMQWMHSQRFNGLRAETNLIHILEISSKVQSWRIRSKFPSPSTHSLESNSLLWKVTLMILRSEVELRASLESIPPPTENTQLSPTVLLIKVEELSKELSTPDCELSRQLGSAWPLFNRTQQIMIDDTAYSPAKTASAELGAIISLTHKQACSCKDRPPLQF